MVRRSRGTLMVRSLTFAVAFALGTVSIPAHALGLGDIKATSTLNQAFQADIALFSVAKEKLDSVRVKLAGVREFEKAGIERFFFLTLLKFEPERLPDGRAVIRVTSDFPIREPFLDFLVEINWPNGRLIREYTVLLDPPVITKRREPRVQVAPVRMTTSHAAATPRRSVPPVMAGKGGYGPVDANETLWSIARKLRPNGASMQQMVIALHRANPEAFIGGDINRLKRGQVLRVPSTDEVLSLSRAEARQVYRQAQEQWLAQRSEHMQQAAGKKVPPGQGTAGSVAATSDSHSELRITTASPEDKGEVGASEIRGNETNGDIKHKLLLARENAEASRLEAETFRNEVDDLQKRLEDMHRLLMLKDEQLARLQAQTGKELDASAEGQGGDLEEVMRQAGQIAGARAEAVSVIADDLIAAADAVVEENNAGGVSVPPVVEPQPVVSGTDSGQATPEAGVTENAEGMAPVLVGTPSVIADDLIAAADAVVEENNARGVSVPLAVEPQPVASGADSGQTPPEVAVQSPVDTVMENSGVVMQEAGAPSLYGLDIFDLLRDSLPIVAGGGILALLLTLLGIRRKRAEAEEGEALDDLAASSVAEETWVDEFAAEVDPVYTAYGCYQDRLEQALIQAPDQLELKHRLLKVYYATRNVTAFNDLSESMVEKGQDIVDPDAWSRICDMGHEISPDNNLYQNDTSSQVTPQVDVVDDDAGTESAARIGEELSGLFTPDDLDGEVDGLQDSVDVSSLDLDGLDTRPLDLDLSSVESVAVVDHPGDTIDLPALDVAIDEGLAADEKIGSQLEGPGNLSKPEDDLSCLTEDIAPDLDTSSAQRGRGALDEPLSIDEAFDKAVDEEIDISNLAPEVLDAEAVETRLDLARAFLEMGDPEGAKGILEDIRQEGNETQCSEAEKLLADIG